MRVKLPCAVETAKPDPDPEAVRLFCLGISLQADG
jgi:hypothetical protein